MPKFKLSGFSVHVTRKLVGSRNRWVTDGDINGLTAKYTVVEKVDYSSLEHRRPPHLLTFFSHRPSSDLSQPRDARQLRKDRSRDLRKKSVNYAVLAFALATCKMTTPLPIPTVRSNSLVGRKRTRTELESASFGTPPSVPPRRTKSTSDATRLRLANEATSSTPATSESGRDTPPAGMSDAGAFVNGGYKRTIMRQFVRNALEKASEVRWPLLVWN